ncbi:hypothetical protein FHX37_2867 [Haloactinospora alba]|uniref:Uncharacterized protein n=2 Tax=Haloactinospora alba TaxID=405555 RepID=A0A543NM28_9ACTN|nr:hypothetical protein FHX37_2867 [Haloactinospora alba]
MAGAVAAVLVAIVLGVVTFGIGMSQESVYAVPGLWRGGIDSADDGFFFVLQPNFLGIAGVVAVGMVTGLVVGVLRGARR